MVNTRRVLLVSKPVEPPWNDSSKNLVRDLAAGMRESTPYVMGRRGQSAWTEGVHVRPVYPKLGRHRFSPPLADNARVLAALSLEREADLLHFFFAPNRASSTAGRVVRRLKRLPTVHSVCSAPRIEEDLAALCFADVTVALSRSTETRLLASGIPRDRVRRIPPCVAPLARPTETQRKKWRLARNEPEDGPLLIYPGDVEFGMGAELSLRALAKMNRSDVRLIMACRAKTPQAADKEQTLRRLAGALGIAEQTRWIGETHEIHTWLAMADIVLLPSTDLFAKMDYPLAILEAMSLARPVVVAAGSPSAELAEYGGVVAPPASVGDTATAIARLVDDSQARRDLGDAGRAAVKRVFTPVAIAAQYEALYRDLT